MLSIKFFSKKETESLIDLAVRLRGNRWIAKLLTLTLVGLFFTGGCSISEGLEEVNDIEPIENNQEETIEENLFEEESFDLEIATDEIVSDQEPALETQTTGEEIKGNTTGNLRDFGFVAEQDGWIYYSNFVGYDKKIYKMRSDGTETTAIVEDWASGLNVIGDWIYYFNNRDDLLYKIRKDGSERAMLENIRRIDLMVDGWMYYTSNSDSNRIYKVRIDGSDKTRLNVDRTRCFDVVGDWIYYSAWKKIYKIRTDGSEKVQLSDEIARGIDVEDGWIYYQNISENDKLYKMRIDGTERTMINDDMIYHFNVSGDWIYYINEENHIYKIRNDGSMLIQLVDEYSGHLNIIEDWVYFTIMTGVLDDRRICKIRSDGSERTCLNEDGSWSLY